MRALKGRRLRIGYVSSDFRKHAVATFFEPLLAAHDRSRFEIFCYYNYPRGDEVTASIRTAVEHFVPIAGVPDRVLAERITGEGIDVLVDLNGHSADNRLPLFFFAAAPVQATWLGYPGTTGVRAIDYRLTDSCADPPGATESLHTETLWRLPTTAWCYEPYAAAPAVTRRDDVRQAIAFTCLNGPGKTSAAALGMWAEILRAVPRSRLQLLASPHAPRMSELLGFFSERGVAPERIELVARQPLASYLALYGNADIALDSYPHTGATTTCDALWMGLPVVTLAGNRPFTRSGASVLTNVGLRDLIAETPADYVRIACALAADHARLARLRAELRATMSGSRLTDGRAFARDMEEAFVAMCQAAAANVRDPHGSTVAGAQRRLQMLRQAFRLGRSSCSRARRGARHGDDPCRRWRRPDDSGARGSRAGRRVGMRQVDAGTDRCRLAVPVRRHAPLAGRATR